MKLDNTVDKFKLPAYLLLDGKQISDDIRATCLELAAKKDDKEFESKVEAIRSTMPTELLTSLDTLGVKLPSDNVTLSVSLGSFLFDCYIKGVTAPVAPLAQALFNKRLQTLSEDFTKSDSIEVDGPIKEAVKKTLLDDDLWNSVAISAKYTVNNEEHYLSLSSAVKECFPNVYSATLEIFLSDTEEVTS